MNRHSARLAVLALCCLPLLTAQPADDTQLKQVIVFGRHSVRSPVAPNSYLDNYSLRPFPVFSVPTGELTANGRILETILGGYYRLWLTREGLLTGNDPADAAFVYCRSNVQQRTVATAEAFWAGLLPAAGVNCTSYPPQESDPLFDPVGAGVARLDRRKAVAAVAGRLGNPQSLVSAYASEFALTRSILFGYPASQVPAPATPPGKTDLTTLPILVAPGTPSLPVDLGGLVTVVTTIDPFLMEYAEGLPPSDVGWGQLTAEGVSQTSRFITLGLDLEYRTPYLSGVQSSNIASHLVRSMVQAATGNPLAGSLGNPSTKLILLIASDANVTGLAGLLRLNWILPGYQPDYCAPGGAIVFELRQSQRTAEYFVRASYVSQTLNQLRNRTPLTIHTPPASAPLFIPGCSVRNATFDCPLANFVETAKRAIDPKSADLTN